MMALTHSHFVELRLWPWCAPWIQRTCSACSGLAQRLETGKMDRSVLVVNHWKIWWFGTKRHQFSFFSHLIGLNRLTIAENDCTWCAKVVKNFLFPFEDMIEGTWGVQTTCHWASMGLPHIPWSTISMVALRGFKWWNDTVLGRSWERADFTDRTSTFINCSKLTSIKPIVNELILYYNLSNLFDYGITVNIPYMFDYLQLFAQIHLCLRQSTHPRSSQVLHPEHRFFRACCLALSAAMATWKHQIRPWGWMGWTEDTGKRN